MLQAVVSVEHLARPCARRLRSVRSRTPSFTSGRCTGPSSGRRGGVPARSGLDALVPLHLRGADAEAAAAAITLSPFRRPTAECAPVDAKAGCLYPNNARALIEAQARGFDNCLMRDMLGNVAELGTANVFMAKDGVVYTPAPNGTFLNGITRQRVIELLRDDGVDRDREDAELCGFPGRRRDLLDRQFLQGRRRSPASTTATLQPGRFYRKARELYWDFAHSVMSRRRTRRLCPHCGRSDQRAPCASPEQAAQDLRRQRLGADRRHRGRGRDRLGIDLEVHDRRLAGRVRRPNAAAKSSVLSTVTPKPPKARA